MTKTKHSEYVIIIVFSKQQWLQERAEMLHYMFLIHISLYCLKNFYMTRKDSSDTKQKYLNIMSCMPPFLP